MIKKTLVTSVSFSLDELKTLQSVCAYLVPLISNGCDDDGNLIYNNSVDNLVDTLRNRIGVEYLDFLREIRDLDLV